MHAKCKVGYVSIIIFHSEKLKTIIAAMYFQVILHLFMIFLSAFDGVLYLLAVVKHYLVSPCGHFLFSLWFLYNGISLRTFYHISDILLCVLYYHWYLCEETLHSDRNNNLTLR